MSDTTAKTEETDWVPYAIGGGALFFGGLLATAFAAKTALPYAIALGAPEYLPQYEAWRKAKDPEEKRQHALKFVQGLKADQNLHQTRRR